jgi:hypothetical protein
MFSVLTFCQPRAGVGAVFVDRFDAPAIRHLRRSNPAKVMERRAATTYAGAKAHDGVAMRLGKALYRSYANLQPSR